MNTVKHVKRELLVYTFPDILEETKANTLSDTYTRRWGREETSRNVNRNKNRDTCRDALKVKSKPLVKTLDT